MIALSDVRKEFTRILQGFDLNAYSYPETQPEYPCWRLAWLDALTLHQAMCVEGVRLDVQMQLMVAAPDTEDATQRLEDIISSGVLDALESADSTVWTSLAISEVRNFRQLDDVNGLACDVVIVIHI
jgi:hypothetical protein